MNRKYGLPALTLLSMITFSPVILNAQEDTSKPEINAWADFNSSYIWRGSKLGIGPAVQPSVEFSAGGFAVGVWGTCDASGYMEADPYISYSFPFGLSLGFSDYYYPDLSLFDVSDTSGSHAFEFNCDLSVGGLNLSANYILNEAGGAGSCGGDLYFEAGYSFNQFGIFVGAGNGWYTTDNEFSICNIGIETNREIKITDSFTLPVFGQIIVNPEQEKLFVVVGFSL
jgi:hypothetical protein